MKIAIIGAGKMGAWLAQVLAEKNEIALYSRSAEKLQSLGKVKPLKTYDELKKFAPELLINCVSLQYTTEVFDAVIPYLPKTCILSDITSVKNELPEYYQKQGMRFVSTHPMFGPTFADMSHLKGQNAIIITESDAEGKDFFRKLYQSLKLNIYDYNFKEHDERTAYSLSTPFASSMVFAACMKNQEAPGTTFKKHLEIAKGLLSEDDYLLAEIMFNPYTLKQIEMINAKLSYLTHIIKGKDHEEMEKFLKALRDNIE
ncbi:MAG: prephenate dehydrogenase/arogenate dehydrogenase family protein [Candidatus Margulisbacteria bacterium]|nr:prephenate dehydrogenase/arogenate dehydrogenase family protein [Candidatus Margulisiibacteriota bacterium]